MKLELNSIIKENHPTLNRVVQLDEILILLRNGEETLLITTNHEKWRVKQSLTVILEQLRRQHLGADHLMKSCCEIVKEQHDLKSLTTGLTFGIKQLVPICGLSSSHAGLYAGHLIKDLIPYQDQTLLDFGDHQYLVDATCQKAKRIRMRANEVASLMQTSNTYLQILQQYSPNEMTPQEYHVCQCQAQRVQKRQLEIIIQQAHQFLYGEAVSEKDLQRVTRHFGYKDLDWEL